MQIKVAVATYLPTYLYLLMSAFFWHYLNWLFIVRTRCSGKNYFVTSDKMGKKVFLGVVIIVCAALTARWKILFKQRKKLTSELHRSSKSLQNREQFFHKFQINFSLSQSKVIFSVSKKWDSLRSVQSPLKDYKLKLHAAYSLPLLSSWLANGLSLSLPLTLLTRTATGRQTEYRCKCGHRERERRW